MSGHNNRLLKFSIVRGRNLDIFIRISQLILLGSLLVTSGCANLPRNAIPIDEMQQAEVPGFPGVRAWAGHLSETFQADMQLSMSQEGDVFLDRTNDKYVYSVLALSGGGSNGAFGAGVLNGWTKSGRRPPFKLITGISTGALIAPFAFLGREYDIELEDFYTHISTPDILEKLGLFKFLNNPESFASTKPLQRLLEQVITEDLIRAIASKHKLGYRLYIGTTHLDAQQLMIWNMGMIASSESAGAIELFRSIMLASASVPVIFPPVLIQVEANGELYDEMHVDGGASVQVFYYRNTVNMELISNPKWEGRDTEADLYVIRNGKILGIPKQTPRKVEGISRQALSAMTKAGAKGDLFRIYAVTQRDDIDFEYISIPEDFQSHAKEEFDTEAMQRVFELGYELGFSGDGWRNAPPGLRGDDAD
jgi:hypothetical protein